MRPSTTPCSGLTVKADQAIESVREWRRYNYGPHLASAVVIAETDWLAYVHAMAATLPDENLAYPAEEDVLWDWPEGVVMVFAEPVEIQHTIVSHSVPGGEVVPTTPHFETQTVAGLCILRRQPVPTRVDGQAELREPVTAYPTIWIGTDPSDTVSGHWLPGSTISPAVDTISQSSLMLVSMITALGHRLTRVVQPSGSRGERRRAERELPGLRVLELASGASVQRGHASINYSHRWMVRGHWRLQPHGPERSLRKPIWIDPYVKGPEDKPLDVRETIWRRR